MAQKISVVINTFNEEVNIEKAIKSVSWADEIIVCDMHSGDNTVAIAKKLGAKIFFHGKVDYVEPARNYAISKASGDWILVLDADEDIPETLAKRLQEITGRMKQVDVVEIPRKNIIFGKWINHTGWWPDYQVRFFKKGTVSWQNEIHSKPQINGQSFKLKVKAEWAIVHQNYKSLEQFIERMNRYSNLEAKQLQKMGYQFKWQDLLEQPLNEFLSRFFAREGYKDGLHGLVLSMLQAFSFLVVYLKAWETEKFGQQELNLEELEIIKNKDGEELNYWFKKSRNGKNIFKTFLKKLKT